MQNNKLLLVEDESKVADFIKKGLAEFSYDVDIALDGVLGKNKALSHTYDLIILDVNLPLLNGYQLCKIIRESGNSVPILMLTALGNLNQKVLGFEAGADDYLLKPFEFQELLIRIKALIKRAQKTQNPLNNELIIINDLEINRDAKTVKIGNKTIELTAKEFSLLEYLALNKGKVISKTEIATKVWDINFDPKTNSIEVYINFLRKKIDSDAENKLIHTRPGLGYTIISIPEK
jgi:two-component system, OmpR family, copper resistance phosphate regulon response regulator CusR